MLIHLITLFSLVVSIVHGQLVSPCPDVFKYEPRDLDQPDRWYGVLTVGTDEDLEGVWIKIILDRKADLLGNWFSEAVSKDNIAYSIRNSQYKLAAGPPILVRFFVKYNPASVIPTVQKILLNGKTICPIKQTGPTEPTLHISVGKPNSGETSEDPYRNQNSHSNSSNGNSHSSNSHSTSDRQSSGNSNFNNSNINSHITNRHTTSATTYRPQNVNREPEKKRPLSNILPSTGSDDDDFYQGDFHIFSNQRSTSRPSTPSRGSVQCGTVAQRPSPLISYGQATTPGQWPWHAALYIFQGTELKYTCGGTLISDRYVVTAAHCVTKPRTSIIVKKDKLVVYLGKYNLISFSGEVQDRQIESIIVHPDYNASVYFSDIAVLKLESPVELNNYVRPCCLWEDRDTDIENLVGQKGTVVGWGFNENGELSKNLMQTQLPVVSTKTCLFSNRNFFSQFISDSNFCVGFRNDTSVCNGDSGGGMVFPKLGTSGQNTVWQLRGIISLGVARQNDAGICDPKQYSILTDCAKYLQWIKDSMRN